MQDLLMKKKYLVFNQKIKKIPDISSIDVSMIIDLKRAIKNKKIIAFLSCKEDRKEVKINE